MGDPGPHAQGLNFSPAAKGLKNIFFTYISLNTILLIVSFALFLLLKRGLYTANPAGGISSNAEDMAKWMNYILGYGPPEMDQEWATSTFEPEMVYTNVPYYSKPQDPVTMQANNYYGRAWYAGHYRGMTCMYCICMVVIVNHNYEVY